MCVCVCTRVCVLVCVCVCAFLCVCVYFRYLCETHRRRMFGVNMSLRQRPLSDFPAAASKSLSRIRMVKHFCLYNKGSYRCTKLQGRTKISAKCYNLHANYIHFPTGDLFSFPTTIYHITVYYMYDILTLY